MNILINTLLGLDLLVGVLMIFVILMQRPKSEGLGAAFGGGVTENIFGAQTTTVLTKITGWLAGMFFLLTFVLSILYAQRSMGSNSLRRDLLRSQAASTPLPIATPALGSPPPGDGATAPAPTVKPEDLAVGAVPVPPTTAVPSATPTPPKPQSP